MSNGPSIILQKHYQGNQTLKRSGVQIEWSKEWIEEYQRCAEDPIYFIEKYLKIIHVDEGLIPLNLYVYQKDIINTIHSNRNVIITAARQSGKSVSFIAYALWYILFNESKAVAILANKGSTARELLGRLKLAYQHLPLWLQIGVEKWNEGSVWLENGSRIIADATSSDAIRGWSFSFIIIDEAAHIDKWDDFSKSVFPTISSGKTTKLVLISTPNGLNHFYQTWSSATKGLNGYIPIEIHWTKVPGRDEEWKQKVLKDINFDQDKFDQEYNLEFMGSSGTLISGARLKELVNEETQPENKFENLSVYELPIPKRKYCITCDVAEGKGLDYSAFHVIDITDSPYRQSVVFRSNEVSAFDFACFIHRVAKTYNDAIVLIEMENVGPVVSNHLWMDLEYENMIFTKSAGAAGKRITFEGGTGTDKGVKMTKAVKALGCSMLKMLVEQHQLILFDHDTISELTTFSRQTGGSFGAEPEKYDDTVMALVVFGWLNSQPVFREISEVDVFSKLREKTDAEIEEGLLPLGFRLDGTPETEEVAVNNDAFSDNSWMFM